ncbi:OmpA family protein [Chitinophaga sp. Cy-1792]|uniref:OmpA family protein n=1 Tax=Chitinophaga sp. Cy-1792 TaxID=2608339 RepID=UPI0014242291|nr:OmpA family protein [Chitinophaga sp. Cy-1792]NIG53246.1 OmpA family protein [Chitinophaga sp. Cy-1792]
MKKTILPLLAICFTMQLHAQVVTSENAPKKARASFDKAQAAISVYHTADAVPFLKEAINIAPNYLDAYGQLGMCYIELKDYKEAVNTFSKFKQLDSSSLRQIMVPYSRALAGTGDFNGALQMINQYIAGAKVSSRLAEKLKANYTFAVNDKNKNHPFQPNNLGDNINSKDPEYFPSLTIDSKTLIYTRRVNGNNEDFYISQRQNNTWGPSQDMGAPINTSFNEGAQHISQDGTILLYTGCEFPEGKGSCDLYISRKTKNGWTKPENLGAPVNTRDWESQPSLSADNQTLYFARETPTNGSDIFVSHLLPNGKWSNPENLGPNINTKGRETTPFIHADGQTLYFASEGLPGYGGLDIFYSRKQPDGSWGPAVNLGYPINTIDEEGSLVVDAAGTTAYFASDRADGKGSLDIYSFELYPEARPLQTLYVKGFVYDSTTQQRLPASVDVIDLQGGTQVARFETDENGNFLAPLPTGKDYAFHVGKKGYLFYSDNFSLKEHNPGQPFEKNIPLQPLAANASIVLHNIFFDTKQYVLKPASMLELDRLVRLLNDNPTLKIEIDGHTDNIGSDKDNKVLSENRAKAVVDYLVSKGIPAERLSSKGFGKSQPVASNDTEEGRAENRRTVFKVVSL